MIPAAQHDHVITHPAPGPLEVRPETRIRVIVGGAAVGIIAVCALIGVATAGGEETYGFLRLLTWAAVCALVALLRTAGWHTLRAVRIEGGDLVLEHADRTLRRFPLAQVGGLGYRGTAVAGRLFDGIMFGGSATAGRLVVVDREGRLLIARRAGWMTFDDLRRFCAAAGLAWVDHRSFLVPVVPVPPPYQTPVYVDPSAPADAAPGMRLAIAASRRARRIRLGSYVGLFAGGIGLCAIADALPLDPHPVGLTIAGVIASIAGFFLLMLAPLNEDRPRPIMKALRRSRWVFAECVVAAGLDSDGSRRLLGVFSPDGRGAPVVWAKLGRSGMRGWLQDGERRWFWVAWDAKGRATAIATPEMDRVAVLPKDGVGSRQVRKATEAYLQTCDLEYWNPDTPPGAMGPSLGLDPAGPHPGYGAAPSSF